MQQQSHTTYSMQNILNQPLDSEICRRVLEEIKSPLMEQSFILTNDESVNSSYIQPPKRPDIPPAPYGYQFTTRRPAIKNKSQTQGEFFRSRERDLSEYGAESFGNLTADHQNGFIQGAQNGVESRIQIESIVSPLDFNRTAMISNQQTEDSWLDFFNPAALLCGNLFDTNIERDHETHLQAGNQPIDKLKYDRRKIFKTNHKSTEKVASILLQRGDEVEGHISVEAQKAVIDEPSDDLIGILKTLRQNKHYEISDFLELIVASIEQLKQTVRQRNYMQSKMNVIYGLLDQEQNCFEGVTKVQQNYSKKVLSRFNLQSLPQLIGRMATPQNQSEETFNQSQEEQREVIKSIESIVSCLSNVEKSVDALCAKGDPIQTLKIAYKVMVSSFATKNPNITLAELIGKLFEDIGYTNHKRQIPTLEYFWPGFCASSISQQDFIHGIVKDRYRYQQRDLSQSRNKLEENLQKIGFCKNI